MIVTAREFTSAAELRAHAAAVHQRCFDPPLRRVKPEEPVRKSVPSFVTRKVPLWIVKDIHFDAHLVEWRDRASNRPLAYLKDRCRELGIPYRDMIVRDSRRKIAGIRQELMWEVHTKFGMSFPAIGRLFGGRDHTTCLYAVRKIQAQRGEA